MPLTAAATVDEPFTGGMPLVLKDGRIATVTVHVVQFETGADTLDASTSATLRATFEPLATDCFLTAQAIGHVAPGITRDGDTLAAHRLARARADAIQAALVDFGMPQPSVASVWDWQFLLPESRATVWVFSLTRGDDCEGKPLPKGEPALAAATRETVSAAAEALGSVRASAEPPEAAAVAAQPPARVPPPTPPAELRVAEPNAAVSRAPAPRDPLATAAVAPVEARTGSAVAETEAPETTIAAIDPDLPRAAGSPALAITFEMNSSYFPADASRELRAFLDSLPSGGQLEIELLGAVGTSGVRGASGEEAQRYNAWMAERRIERVVEWLEKNAGGRQLTFAERLVEDDPSRQVRLRANGSSR